MRCRKALAMRTPSIADSQVYSGKCQGAARGSFLFLGQASNEGADSPGLWRRSLARNVSGVASPTSGRCMHRQSLLLIRIEASPVGHDPP